MTALVAFVIAPLVVALFYAGANFGVWWYRREEDDHRWLALACVASAALVAATGLLFTSRSREDALIARELFTFLAPPAAFGILRFWSHRFRLEMPRLEGVTIATTLLLCVLGLIPGVLYGEDFVTRGIGLGGLRYVDLVPTGLGKYLPLAFLPLGALVVIRTLPRLAADPERRLVAALSLLCNASLASDTFVLGGWYDAPLLFATSFAFTGVVLTGYMLRRFVAAMERLEASAGLLQQAAEQRARELREADLELAHGARLAALGTLAAGLAHEINNPVAFIRSNLNYLDELSREPEGDAEMEEALAETEEGVARVRGIVAELLRMSAQSDARFAALELDAVVESVLPTLRFEARDDVRLETRLAAVPRVWGDRNLLGQIVANLVMNAIQAIRNAGAYGEVRIDTFAEPASVVLEVSDTGPGVPPELSARIFEPFFTTKPAGEGTGLGLAVTRQLVERLGGHIALVPAARGACFRVELPLPPQPAAASA